MYNQELHIMDKSSERWFFTMISMGLEEFPRPRESIRFSIGYVDLDGEFYNR